MFESEGEKGMVGEIWFAERERVGERKGYIKREFMIAADTNRVIERGRKRKNG